MQEAETFRGVQLEDGFLVLGSRYRPYEPIARNMSRLNKHGSP